mmetsp:Transcript_81025/g.251416  ORF Transcript_81025/g.251416 Transcript_81025/m.251416 type:complete len:260 (+) Transcript_81025:280-1059(+)
MRLLRGHLQQSAVDLLFLQLQPLRHHSDHHHLHPPEHPHQRDRGGLLPGDRSRPAEDVRGVDEQLRREVDHARQPHPGGSVGMSSLLVRERPLQPLVPGGHLLDTAHAHHGGGHLPGQHGAGGDLGRRLGQRRAAHTDAGGRRRRRFQLRRDRHWRRRRLGGHPLHVERPLAERGAVARQGAGPARPRSQPQGRGERPGCQRQGLVYERGWFPTAVQLCSAGFPARRGGDLTYGRCCHDLQRRSSEAVADVFDTRLLVL